jgi:transposase
MHAMGEERSEQLDYRAASLIRVQTARIKHACRCERGGVVVPSRSDGGIAPVIEKDLTGPGLLAHVVVGKYVDQLPLNRLEERFAREGVHLAKSILCDWVAQVADLLAPISDPMAKAMLAAHRIHTDDTGIAVLAKAARRRVSFGPTSRTMTTSSSAPRFKKTSGACPCWPSRRQRSLQKRRQSLGHVLINQFAENSPSCSACRSMTGP